MVKKVFIPAEINIVKVKAANIITTSGGSASLACPTEGLCTDDTKNVCDSEEF